MFAPLAKRGEHGLGRGHARKNRIVGALDARHVQEASRAAEQRSAGKHEFRDRLPAALAYGARAISDAFATFEDGGDDGMRLEALELLERIDVRVRVVEMQHEANGHLAIAIVVKERAATGPVIERPAERVLHEAGLVLIRSDLP